VWKTEQNQLNIIVHTAAAAFPLLLCVYAPTPRSAVPLASASLVQAQRALQAWHPRHNHFGESETINRLSIPGRHNLVRPCLRLRSRLLPDCRPVSSTAAVFEKIADASKITSSVGCTAAGKEENEATRARDEDGMWLGKGRGLQ
jgi:hypothetical protein